MEYIPDRWILIKIITPENEVLYKVLAGWFGGYLGSDSWKINSGITSVEENDNSYEYTGYTGSVYVCRKSSYGTTMLSLSILGSLGDRVSVVPESEVQGLKF